VPVAVKRDDAIAQLATVPLFKGLSKKELLLVARLAKEQRYAKGTNIVETGVPGHGLYVIRAGGASVLRDGRTIARLKPGDFFGEVAMLDAGARTATVQADADTVCLTLASWEIKPLLMDHAAITYKMLQEVVRRLREGQRPAD
jgi:CRP/FNR family transcriptional regulator, cyclic AMP receptor protein